jgi:cyclopropane-fatty-acyl-phospholipid synthase
VRHAARHYGVTAVGVTLSREQARWASERIAADGLADVAQVRHGDYRDVRETGFDAVSSIGLTEHVGVRAYPAYFRFLRDRLRPRGRLLNHCITRPENSHTPRVRRGFIDRYVFPDGELTGSGRIISEIQDAGLEVRHEENLREHYARTCAAWGANLVEHWDGCVAEVGLSTAKVWGLYVASSRLGFETNLVQLHQVLAVRPDGDGSAGFPLRPDWGG